MMTKVTSNTSFTLPKGKSVEFSLSSGKGSASIDGSSYVIGTREAFIGPYSADKTIRIHIEHGEIDYSIDDNGDFGFDAPSDYAQVKRDSSGNAVGLVTADARRILIEAFADLKAENSGPENIAALQSAHDALSNTGGIVRIPEGVFDVSGGTVDISEGRDGVLGKQQIIFRGIGIGATRLVQTASAVPVFSKSYGHAHSFEAFELVGDKTTGSCGIYWENAAGGACWRDVMIRDFDIGAAFVDATSMTFDNCHFHGSNINVALGYNCDIFQFIGGRIQNSVAAGVKIGYRDSGHPSGALLCNPISFFGVRFGANPVAVDVPDYGASNISFIGCYFEDNLQIAKLGDASTLIGPKGILFDNCFFTYVGGGGAIGAKQSLTQIVANTHANQDSTIEFRYCRSDDTAFAGRWVDLGYNGAAAFKQSDLITTGSGIIQWNGSTYTLNKREELAVGTSKKYLSDGAANGALIPIDVLVTNGTNEPFAKFRRINGTTGADLGIVSANIKDVGGQIAVFDGGILFATPSASLPTASATYRGISVLQPGGAGVADTVVCCMKSSSDTYAWKVIATG